MKQCKICVGCNQVKISVDCEYHCPMWIKLKTAEKQEAGK